MPILSDASIDELRANVVRVLPALTECSEAEHLNKIKWAEIDPPFVAMVCSDFQEADWGVANLSEEGNVDLYYVAQVVGDSSGLRAAINTLVDRFWPADVLTTMQVLGLDAPRYDDDLDVNQLLASAGRSQRAGMVRLRCLVQKV